MNCHLKNNLKEAQTRRKMRHSLVLEKPDPEVVSLLKLLRLKLGVDGGL